MRAWLLLPMIATSALGLLSGCQQILGIDEGEPRGATGGAGGAAGSGGAAGGGETGGDAGAGGGACASALPSVTKLGGADQIDPTALAVNDDDGIFIGGVYNGASVEVGGGVLPDSGGMDVGVLVQLSNEGVFKTHHEFDAVAPRIHNVVARGSEVWVAGAAEGPLYIDGKEEDGIGGGKVFVAGLEDAFKWLQVIRTAGNIELNDMVVDDNGTVFFGGAADASISWGLVGNNAFIDHRSAFIAKATKGNLEVAVVRGEDMPDVISIQALALANGQVLAFGDFTGTISPVGQTATLTGTDDLWIAHVDSESLAFSDATALTSSPMAHERATDIVAFGETAYVAGSFDASTNIGTPVNTNSGSAIYVASLSSTSFVFDNNHIVVMDGGAFAPTLALSPKGERVAVVGSFDAATLHIGDRQDLNGGGGPNNGFGALFPSSLNGALLSWWHLKTDITTSYGRDTAFDSCGATVSTARFGNENPTVRHSSGQTDTPTSPGGILNGLLLVDQPGSTF